MLNSDVTLRRVIWELKQWADNHKMINKFMGFGEYLQTQLESERVYPIMVVNVTTSPSETWYINYQFEVMILDWVKDDQSNRSRVMSDTRQVLNDLEETISFSNRWNDFSKLKGSFNCTDAIEKGRDKSFGWIGTFTLGVKKRHGICNIKALLPEYDFESGEFIPATCAPVTVEINGTATTPTPSGSNKAINIEYENGDPVVITEVSDTATDFNGTIPNLPSPNNSLPINSGAYILGTFYANDDAFINFGRGGVTDPFYLLEEVNPFGNFYAYTGKTGGYQDPDDMLYYDKDGVVTTRSLAFPNEVCLCWKSFKDNVSVLALNMASINNSNIDNQKNILDDAPYTHDSYSDWQIINRPVGFFYYNEGKFRDFFNFPPLNYAMALPTDYIWSSYLESFSLGYAFSITGYRAFSSTNTYRSFIYRLYTYAELGL